MPAKRQKQGGNSSTGRGKQQWHAQGLSKSQAGKSADKNAQNASGRQDEQRVYHFQKDEIVWAKMKFFSAWPAKVRRPFSVAADSYLKKKMLPKMQVDFFDDPPTIGEIHQNQIFKFVQHFQKYAKATNKKLQYGIFQAEQHLQVEERQMIKKMRKEMGQERSDEEDSAEDAQAFNSDTEMNQAVDEEPETAANQEKRNSGVQQGIRGVAYRSPWDRSNKDGGDQEMRGRDDPGASSRNEGDNQRGGSADERRGRDQGGVGTARDSRKDIEEDGQMEVDGKKKQNSEERREVERGDGGVPSKLQLQKKLSSASGMQRGEGAGQSRNDGNSAKMQKMGSGSPNLEPLSGTKSPYADTHVKKQVQFNTQSEDNEQVAGISSRVGPAVDDSRRDGNDGNHRDQQVSFAMNRGMKKSEDGDAKVDGRERSSRHNEPHSAVDILRTKHSKENQDSLSPMAPGLSKQSSHKVGPHSSKHGKQHLDEFEGPNKRHGDQKDDEEEDGDEEEDAEDADSSMSKSNKKRSSKMHNENQRGAKNDENNEESLDKRQNQSSRINHGAYSPISQKSKRIPKPTPQYMQFVKEQTNSKRARAAAAAGHGNGPVQNQAAPSDQIVSNSKHSRPPKNSGSTKQVRKLQSAFEEMADSAIDEEERKRPDHLGRQDDCRVKVYGDVANRNTSSNVDKFMSVSAPPQDNDDTPKQIRQDSDTFGKNIGTKNHHGASCESIDREKQSICSSNNMDLAFNKKKSTMSSKKSRKESILSTIQYKSKNAAGHSSQRLVAAGIHSSQQNQQPLISTSQVSQKSITREKIQKMKEIKKYFDQFFKEIKEMNFEIVNQNDEFDQLQGFPPKTQKDRELEKEEYQKLVKKTYDKIHLHSRQIDAQIRLIFTEFNELSLVHESKLGHALRDMQQFLQYYQSRDETIQAILGKLDMLIEIQEKKMHIEIFGETPLDFNTLKKHFKKDNSKGFDSAFRGGQKDAQKHSLHRGSTELNHQQMMSSEASYSYRMHYSNKQADDQKMTEQDEEHNSTCTADNNHPMHDTSSQKRSLKNRKRSFRKLNRKHEGSIHEDKGKSKRSHRDSYKKPYSKGPSKSALFRGLFNKSSSRSSQQIPGNGYGTNNYSLRIQNVINQIKVRQKWMQMQQLQQNFQQQLQPQNLQSNLQQQLLQNFQQQQLPQTQCIILNNGQIQNENLQFNISNCGFPRSGQQLYGMDEASKQKFNLEQFQNQQFPQGNSLSPNQNMMILNSLHFQKNMMQQMQLRNMFGQQLAGGATNQSNPNGNMPGKQGDIGDKPQSHEKDSHGSLQQNGGGMDDQSMQDGAGIANQAALLLQKQPQDEKKDGKKNKDMMKGQGQSGSAWTDKQINREALKKLTEQMKASGSVDQLNLNQAKLNLQQLQNLYQMRQLDTIGNLTQQLQQNMDPIQLSQYLSQLQQLGNHLQQSQGVAGDRRPSHLQQPPADAEQSLQDQLRQLRKLMQGQQEQQNMEDDENEQDDHDEMEDDEESELQKTLQKAFQQQQQRASKHAQKSQGDFAGGGASGGGGAMGHAGAPKNLVDQFNRDMGDEGGQNGKKRHDAVNPELQSGPDDEADESNNNNQADESESKCASSHNKLSYNGQQLLLLQHIIQQQRQQQESQRFMEAQMRRRELQMNQQDAQTTHVNNSSNQPANNAAENVNSGGKLKQMEEEQDLQEQQ